MASYRKKKNGKWEVQVRKKGYGQKCKTFVSKDVCSQLNYTKQKDKSRIAKTMQRMRDKLELDFGITGIGYYMLPKDLRPKERINFEADKVN